VVDLVGWTASEIVDRPFLELVHPDDVPLVRSAQAAILRAEPRSMRIRVLHKGGDYRWVETNVRPVLDPGGAVVGRMGGWRDIDAEMHARAAQAGSDTLLRTAVRAAAIGMALTDVNGTFQLVNPALARMLGRTRTGS